MEQTNRKNGQKNRRSLILTFLNHEYDVTGGRASARHLNVTFWLSALVTTRLGSSLAKCTETVGGSEIQK